jgi:EAL domain-containing protein (putative c-di-GMP-specific phosphodiesterase class I)
MAALQQMGCDELQGFLLGRPGPAPTLKHSPAPRAPAAQALVA